MKRFGGTGVYHILNETGAPSEMWLIKYEKGVGIVENLTQTPSANGCEDPKKFVEQVVQIYSKATGCDYDFGFERVK